MKEQKNDVVKNIMVNLGVLFILVGSTAMKMDVAFFFLALAILAIQTFEIPSVNAKKLVVAEIMMSATIAISALTQLVVSTASKTQQAFIVVLLLGGLLIVVEAVRKYADL